MAKRAARNSGRRSGGGVVCRCHGRTFASAFSRARHERPPPKRWHCAVCGRRFRFQHGLREHEARVCAPAPAAAAAVAEEDEEEPAAAGTCAGCAALAARVAALEAQVGRLLLARDSALPLAASTSSWAAPAASSAAGPVVALPSPLALTAGEVAQVEEGFEACREAATSRREYPASLARQMPRRELVQPADFLTLAPGAWLSDEVVNAYLRLLVHDTAWFALSSHVCARLDEGVTRKFAQRWTARRRDVFTTLEGIVVPVHQHALHWTLVVVNLRAHCLRYYDSLAPGAAQMPAELRTRLLEFFAQLSGAPADVRDWPAVATHANAQQTNDSDCGVFACRFAACEARGAALREVTQANMPHFRTRVALDLLRGTFSR